VLFDVMFGGFFLMVHGMQTVPMSNVGMMRGLLMAPALIVSGCFLVMAGCMFMVFGRPGMMFCALFAHMIFVFVEM
jgi:hypothetical protein